MSSLTNKIQTLKTEISFQVMWAAPSYSTRLKVEELLEQYRLLVEENILQEQKQVFQQLATLTQNNIPA